MSEKITWVTQPYLPPLAEFLPYLEQIWASKILTNNGAFHAQLEAALQDYLGVEHISLFANGTMALMTALLALDVHGEVITTPYSFVATSHALLWNNLTPVFVDIEDGGFNLDPAKIEAAITEHTSAIMPVHCYAYPCDVEAIQKLADRYHLKVIYDAAHAFGVQHRGQSLLRFGDASVLSFHATKVFNTFEGGAIISPNAELKRKIDHLKNFGFEDEVSILCAGINGKMSEVNAALGVLMLDYVEDILAKRRAIAAKYRALLAKIRGIRTFSLPPETSENAAYFPILVLDEFGTSRDALYEFLKQHQIFSRRYFYPLISNFAMYRHLPSAPADNLPRANWTAERVLCLPIYPDLALEKVEEICALIQACGQDRGARG